MREMYFKTGAEDIEILKEDIRRYTKKFLDFQEDSSDKGWVFQVKKESPTTFGLRSKAVTVTIVKFSQDTFKVALGETKWMSKLVGGLIVLLNPALLITLLALPATISGVVQQNKLINEMSQLIELRLS